MTLVTTQNAGYLDDSYLTEGYLGGSNLGNMGLQFRAVIDNQPSYGTQFRGIIDAQNAEGLQARFVIDALNQMGVQFLGIITEYPAAGVQFRGVITAERYYGLQMRFVIDALKNLGVQFNAILTKTPGTGLQFRATTDDFKKTSGVEFRSDKGISHFYDCPEGGGYLEDAYLSGAYLAPNPCAHMGIQFRGVILAQKPMGLQFCGVIDRQKPMGVQARWIINATHSYGVQFESSRGAPQGLQFNVILYNTDNLRILCDFASRGSSGTNWTANSTAAGDFSPFNLNTDIVEQAWRTNGLTSGVTLTCDTEVVQGVFLDTLGVLNHNLTTSAAVTLLGSNDPTFSVIGATIPLEVRDDENLYYIAPTFPLTGYRYWRFLIDDPTNPDGFVQVGTIVFGNSLIFQGECFVDEVEFGFKDFADTVRTAGHTNVANSRALKKIVGLEFRSLSFLRGNFRSLRSMFKQDRTVTKCLWIPTPDPTDGEYTARFAVFGKLTQIPKEKHNSKGREADYVSFSIEVDESL